MYTDHVISQEEHEAFIENLKRDNRNFYYFVYWQSIPVGVISLARVDLRNRNAYLGVYASPERKIPAAGVILGRSIMDLAFRVAKLHTLKLEVFEDNKRAISFYKRFGFTEEGRLREFVLRNNKWKDVVVMGITEEEFRRRFTCS